MRAGMAMMVQGSTSDPYLANVASLLNMGGAGASTTFIDYTGKGWSANGNAQIDTSLGFNAALFDGTGDYINTADDASFSLTGDFTIEIVLRINSMTLSGLVSNGASNFSGNATALILNHATQANKLSFWCYPINSSAAILATGPLSTGVDYNVAIERSGSTLKLFQDGVATGSTATSSATVPLSNLGLRVGRYWGGDYNGWIRAMRITNGVARYASNYSPTTPPWPTT